MKNLTGLKFLILNALGFILCFNVSGQNINGEQSQMAKDFINANGPAPYTLWQWMNGCVTKKGITYDLEAFKKVGINSVQQFLVGGSVADVTDTSVTILQDKWNELMRYTLDECSRLEMDFGTHNCPGWSSSGAPGLDVQYSMQKLIWSKTAIDEKESKNKIISKPELDNKWNYYKDICVIFFPENSSVLKQEDIKVLIGGLDKDGKLKQPLPKGDWTVFRFGHTTTGKMNVTAPTSGQGLEVDKMSRKALDHFWKLYPAKLIDLAGKYAGNTFKRFEIDSYEAGNQNWTPNMALEFENRKGYELYSWLPVLAGYDIESKELSNRFKSDWQRTINELFADNYYEYLEELIHKTEGMEFLVEPYGTGHKNFDETAIRGIGDMLMCEFWTKPTEWGWETLLPVSSNAHLNGKKIIAAEAFTGQPQYAFQLDLEDLKSTGDLAFCKGVNLFVLHASAHQPWPEFKPGVTMGWWGTQFGPSQTWWNHGATEWIQYLKRCQLLLQNGLFVADLCYLQLYRQNHTRIPEGYKADVCNEKELLTRVAVKDNQLILPDGMSYQMLILPNRPSVSPELASKIESLVNEGAIVVGNGFAGSQGLTYYPESDEEVKAISERLFGFSEVIDEQKNVRLLGKGKLYCNYSPEEALVEEQISKDVEVFSNKESLSWIHRKDSDSHYYFLSNQSKEDKTYQIGFRVSDMQPEIWNPVTGQIHNALSWKNDSNRTIVDINLEGNGSCFVVFRNKVQNEHKAFTNLSIDGKSVKIHSYINQNKENTRMILNNQGEYKLETRDGEILSINQNSPPVKLDLNRDWNLTFQANRGAPESAHFDTLMSLTNSPIPGVKYFSGTVRYSKLFQFEKKQINKSKRILLDLGRVENIATVFINNKKVRTLWKTPYTIDISNFCKSGDNLIEIDITNLWPNRIIGDKNEPDDCIWGEIRDFPLIKPVPVIGRNLQEIPEWVINNTERPSKNRVTFCTFDFFTSNTPLLPSGLIGPVRISIDETIDVSGLN